MLDDLFHYYLKNMEQVGEQARKRAKKIGRQRAVCDYLAGMTDRYTMQEHARIFGPTM
jgi:dGTPase